MQVLHIAFNQLCDTQHLLANALHDEVYMRVAVAHYPQRTTAACLPANAASQCRCDMRKGGDVRAEIPTNMASGIEMHALGLRY